MICSAAVQVVSACFNTLLIALIIGLEKQFSTMIIGLITTAVAVNPVTARLHIINLLLLGFDFLLLFEDPLFLFANLLIGLRVGSLARAEQCRRTKNRSYRNFF